MHLYLMRHADPNYEVDGLTAQGNREAEALAKRLASSGISHIYTSPAGRAIATATYTSKLLDIPFQVEPWLAEPGHLRIEQEGRSFVIWDTFGETVRAATPLPGPSDWTAHPPFDAPEVAHMWQAFRAEADTLLARHGYTRVEGRYRIDHAAGERVAVFCHNGTILLFLAHLLELPLSLVWCGFYAWPASVTTIYFESWSKEWAVPRALNVADVSHIYLAGMRPQPRAMGDWYEAYW